MVVLNNLRHKLNANIDYIKEYEDCVSKFLNHHDVKSMETFIQQSDVSTLEHCLSVSFVSFIICKRLGLDFRAGARGGLLHDFYLYDWHDTKPINGLHGFVHSKIALENAKKNFQLDEREQDIIISHMFPLTLRFPQYAESWVVTIVDKWVSIEELLMYKGVSPLVRMFARKKF